MNDNHLISGEQFSVGFPRCLGDKSSMEIVFFNRDLVGSKKHFIRVDIYPLYSPSHPTRHMAYFDMHLMHAKLDTMKLTMSDGNMWANGLKEPFDIPAVWRGDLALSGYCRVIVSLWKTNYWKAAEQLETLSSPPVYLLNNEDHQPMDWLQVAVTDKCNLRCPMCSRGKGLNPSNIDVSQGVLDALLEASENVFYVGLQGLGEPLMHHDLPGIVQAFRKRLPENGRIAVTTNGTLLNPNYAQRLIDAGVNNFTFSVDGASKNVYEPLRLGAQFEKVIENMRTTVECVKKSTRNDLWVSSNFTMGQTNLEEVPDFVRLAVSIGLDNIHFFHSREYPDMTLTDLDQSLLSEVTEEALQIAKHNGISVRFASSKVSRQQRCPFMSNAYMWITGEVTPCQRMEPPGEPWPTKILGNVKTQSLETIWSSKEAKAFRKGVITGNYPTECSDCTFCDSIVC